MAVEKAKELPDTFLGTGSAVAAHDERWQLVLRIAGSRQFAKSRQLKDILLYIAERSLKGSDVTIKEHEIGAEALGRGPKFDPHNDNIVRVQVGQLRRRLEEYFASEGKEETLRLIVPKGSYVPYFETVRGSVETADNGGFHAAVINVVQGTIDENAAAEVPQAAADPTIAAPGGGKSKLPWRYRGVAILALAMIACGVCVVAARSLSFLIGTGLPNPSASDRLWSGVFGGPQPARIIVSDSCLVMLQDTLDTDITLSDYMSGSYPQNILNRAQSQSLWSALALIARRQYTSLADLNSANSFVELGRKYSRIPAQIKYARYLNAREFKTGNFIFLGSRRGLPWVEMFEPLLGFSMEEDSATKLYYFRNKHPEAGESAAWRQKVQNGSAAESYVDISVTPNLSGSGYVLLFRGLTMQDTELAGELVTRPEFAKVLSSLPGVKREAPSYFEILMRTRITAGVARDPEVVASRVLSQTPPR